MPIPESDPNRIRPRRTSLRIRIAALSLGLAAAMAPTCTSPGSPAGQAHSQKQDGARRLSAILDYAAADYPQALDTTGVTDPLEFAEQESFLHDALEVARMLSPPGGWLPESVEEIPRQVSDTLADERGGCGSARGAHAPPA